MQVGLQRSAFLVVVNFSVGQQDVFNSKVKNIHGLVILRRDLGLWDIAAAILIADEMNHGMLNNDLVQIYFALQCRHNFDIDRQLINGKQRMILIFLGAADDYSVYIGSHVTPVEFKTLNMPLPVSRFI